MALFHCVVRLGSARLVTARLAFPAQFSAALGWAGLFTCRYSCARVTSSVMTIFSGQSVISRVYTSCFGNGTDRLEPRPRWY